MRELIGAALVFVVVVVSLIIGGALVSKTENVTADIAPGETLVSDLATSGGDALTTFASLLPIMALAIVGGLSLFYLMTFLGRNV
jgi:hypothetical protein